MSLYLKLAGYANPVQDMEENLLVNLLDSFETGSYQLILLVSDQKVTAMQKPLLFAEIKEILGTLSKIEEWSNPAPRANTSFQDPVTSSPGRHSTKKSIDRIEKSHLKN